jgi:hypothetical protein
MNASFVNIAGSMMNKTSQKMNKTVGDDIEQDE